MSGLIDPTGISFTQRMDIQREATDVLGRTGLTPCELEAAYLESLRKLRAFGISLTTLRTSMDVLNVAIEGLGDIASRSTAAMQVQP
jgi:hypothetical protein